jgi:hypothetical protein
MCQNKAVLETCYPRCLVEGSITQHVGPVLPGVGRTRVAENEAMEATGTVMTAAW